MIAVFIAGYVAIALEHKMKISKSAIALMLGMFLWGMYLFSGATARHDGGNEISAHLGSTAEILFYLMGALAIVETIDLHNGFSAITRHIRTRQKRRLFWLVAGLTFIMSSVLDNMTSAIVMMILVQKLLEKREDRLAFGSIIVIAANAGGAWTPIGDVTTIMLWINENITTGHIMKTLLLPSIVSLAIPAWLLSRSLKGQLATVNATTAATGTTALPTRGQNGILALGLCCLLAVPVLKSTTGLPPFAGILFTFGALWVYTDSLYNRRPELQPAYRMPEVLARIDLPTILFFLGILMAVAALESAGILHRLSTYLDTSLHNVYLITLVIGILSSVIDNVPLVAASMGMYPVESSASTLAGSYMENFVQNGTFWDLIAYCAGTGGSILIIGSAAGVVVMGLEKINFIWYMKHVSWIALLGFLAGFGTYYLQHFL